MDYISFFKNLFTKMIFICSNIYTCIYGEIFYGHYNHSLYIKPSPLEKCLYYFPSFLNHFYGNLFYKNYLYQKNNLFYLSCIKESKQITAPLLNFKINNKEYKNKITAFANNIPFKYILLFNQINFNNHTVEYKYLKNGIKNKINMCNEIKQLSLIDLLN